MLSSPPMHLLAATNNAHKLTEFRAILTPLGFTVLGGHDVGGIAEVVEDQDSFVGNAVKKAVETARASGRVCFADDSGLEAFALETAPGTGVYAPGVYSARYAGVGASSAACMEKLLARLQGVADRRARFRCVIAVATPTGLVGSADGEVRGTLLTARRGAGGFGYDPIFVPDGETRTFAEMPAVEKDRISHRARALQATIAAGLFARAT